MDPAFHLSGPLQEAPEIVTLAPHELPEFQKSNLGHFHAGVSFDAPEQIGASPWSEAVSLSRVPKKTQLVAHAAIITTNGAKLQFRRRVRSARRRVPDTHSRECRTDLCYIAVLESEFRLRNSPHA